MGLRHIHGGFMAKVFLLQGERKGQTTVLNKRYSFVNGAMVVASDEDANMMKPMLVDFYACKMVDLERYQEALAAQQQKAAEEK